MKCPQCQYNLPFQERICRRCQFCTDIGNYISVEAPRARRSIQRKRIRDIIRNKLVPQSVVQHEVPAPAILAASIVPGLGHALIGRFWEGLAYFSLVCGLACCALLSNLDTWTSLITLGVAFGIHIASIIRVSSLAQEFGAPVRAWVSILLFALLSLLIYTPLTRKLMLLKPQITYVPGYGIPGAADRSRIPADLMSDLPTRFAPTELGAVMGTLVFAGFVFICAWALGRLMSFLFSLPEKKKS